MTQPTIKIHNVETGEVIEREMTAEELAQLEADKISSAERKAAQAAINSAREELLVRLGITAEEAQLLLGGN
jgi:hypothetical protein